MGDACDGKEFGDDGVGDLVAAEGVEILFVNGAGGGEYEDGWFMLGELRCRGRGYWGNALIVVKQKNCWVRGFE